MLLTTLIFFVTLGAVLGLALGYAAKMFHVEGDPRIDKVEALLPGGQCGQCGEAGCRQAAEKMVTGELSPACCPPGGALLAQNVAQLLGVSIDTSDQDTELVARVDEMQCNGCNRCYKACPFDAIVGAPKQLHTVLKDVCTGCQLCEKACTRGCLTMSEVTPSVSTWYWPKPSLLV